jgi:DNA-binding NtrC family response regulator
LRTEARELAESWRDAHLDPDKEGYDYFSEALSFVMWRERKELASAALEEPWCARIERQPFPGNFAEMREHVAIAFDRSDERTVLRAVETFAPSRAAERSNAEPDRTGPEAEVAHRDQPAVPTSLSRDQLLRQYYIALLREERGDLRRVALRAGRRLRSLHAELARLDVRSATFDPFAPPPAES